MKKKLHPRSREAHEAVQQFIRSMTPEEALAFLTYRDPDVPMTDMLGIFGLYDAEDKKEPAAPTEQKSADDLRDAA